MKWYADGAGWNGRLSKYAIANDDDVMELFQTRQKLANSEAEYKAIEVALRRAADGDEVCSDSHLTVLQIKGKYRVRKEHLIEPRQRCVDILIAKPKIRLTWIPRSRNIAGKVIEWSKGGKSEKAGGEMHVVYPAGRQTLL